MQVQQVLPYPDAGNSKTSQVREMFDRIAQRYDLLNHLLSFNLDRSWRKACARVLAADRPERILDVASGTGDLAIAIAALHPKEIIATDLSEGMLAIAEQKIKAKNLKKIIYTQIADGENLPFEDNTFHAVTIAFGLRNFTNIHKGITEFFRVLRPGGTILILEFSLPANPILRKLYLFYFRNIVPLIGRVFSGEKKAYAYLNKSVEAFPAREIILDVLQTEGFTDCKVKSLSAGISSIYSGVKKASTQ